MAKQNKSQQSEIARVRVDNTPTAVKNMAKWLRECIYLISEDDSKARFSRIVCRQMVKGNKRGEEVFSMDVSKKADDTWADNAASEIYGKLQLETATLGGLQKYALYAYHTGDNENHSSRFVIRLQGVDDDDDGDDLNSEGPDKAGQISQNMRHTEAMAKIMAAMVPTLVTGFQTMITRQSSIVDKQGAMIETLIGDKLAGIETMRALSDDAEEREIRLSAAKAKAKGIEQLVGRLGLLLPAVANKVSGKPIFPVQDTAVMMMVKGLFTSLAADESKLQALAQILAPEQSVAFMNILEEVSAKVGDDGLPVKKEPESKDS
jgi:hypothetical protein